MLATTSTRFCHPSAIGGFSDGETWFHWFDEDQGAEAMPSHSELHLSFGVSLVGEQAQKPKGGCRVRSDAAVASSNRVSRYGVRPVNALAHKTI
jgi:hypothetical protein